jgi:hypothetical protein
MNSQKKSTNNQLIEKMTSVLHVASIKPCRIKLNEKKLRRSLKIKKSNVIEHQDAKICYSPEKNLTSDDKDDEINFAKNSYGFQLEENNVFKENFISEENQVKESELIGLRRAGTFT